MSAPSSPGRCQQGQREQVGGDRGQGPAPVRGVDRRPQVADRAARPRVLQQDAEQRALRLRLDHRRGHLGDDQLDAERLGPGGQHGQRLRQAVGVGQEDPAPAGRPPGQRHRLGGRGRLVQQRCPGDRQRGQVGDGRLEGEQRLQPALRDFRLVGGVGRVPGRVLQHVAADHRRGDGRVVAQADHRGGHGVLGGQRAQLGERLRLGRGRRQVQRAGVGQPGRQGSGGEVVERGVADRAQHPLLLVGGWSYVPCGEVHRSLQREPPGTPRACLVLPLCRDRPGRGQHGRRPGAELQRCLSRPVLAA